MPYIDVISHRDAKGTLKEIYDELVRSRGKLAEVHMIQSLNPPTIMAHMDLYLKIMFGKSPLRRYQREMLGVIVSQANNCNYCVKHHAEALLFFWKDKEKIEKFLMRRSEAGLSEIDHLLCDWAHHLTTKPGSGNHQKWVQNMQKHGISDRAILDASLVISYFNFVNRLVMGLGVELESDGGKGYVYD